MPSNDNFPGINFTFIFSDFPLCVQYAEKENFDILICSLD